MPEIIVNAADGAGGAVMLLRERVTIRDFESPHFCAQLVQRLSWAVSDAHGAEQIHQTEGGSPAGQADRSQSATGLR